MGRIFGHAFQRLDDHRFDPSIIDCPRRSDARRIAKPVDPMLNKPPAPLANGVFVDLELGGNLLVLQALRARQHNPRPQRRRLSRLAP